MPKTPKINVLTVTLKVDIPVDPGDVDSVQEVAGHAERLGTVARELGETTIETRLNRVSAPEPKSEPEGDEPETGASAPDGLDIPDKLRRVPKSKAAAE